MHTVDGSSRQVKTKYGTNHHHNVTMRIIK